MYMGFVERGIFKYVSKVTSASCLISGAVVAFTSAQVGVRGNLAINANTNISVTVNETITLAAG